MEPGFVTEPLTDRCRAHENGPKMRNRSTAGTGALGLACTELHILDWRFLRGNGPFQTLHRTVLAHFETSRAFRDLCLRESRAVVGAASSVYCYHRTTPFVEALYGGDLPVRPSPRQGYVVVRPW
ncbi:tRNA-dependent cyclodipeptide synthase [Streptomyces sp. CA-249302]|uniref:tRNA-dependent cyclodipeptide synthase n=1 Tax=Streptomyces sp. CA-249302 TaxID=3240058 RepID=UPI003D8E562B